MPALPLIAWHGRPPPEALRALLDGQARFVPGPVEGSSIAVLWGDSDDQAIHSALAAAERPRLLVVCLDPPPAAVCRRWQQLGADRVVAVAQASLVLEEWLSRPTREELPDDPASFDSTGSRLAFELETPAPSASSSLRLDGPDPFPSLRVPGAPEQPNEAVQAYVVALERYLERREELTAALGADGLSRFLELAHLREQVPACLNPTRTRLDPYGRGRAEDGPDWPVLVRRLRSRGAEIELSEGRVVSIGTDGLVIVSLFAAAPRQRLLLDLPLDEISNVQLICEARWQRRMGMRRWQVGALLLELRRRRLPPTPA